MLRYERYQIEDELHETAFYRVSNGEKGRGLLLFFAFDKIALKKER